MHKFLIIRLHWFMPKCVYFVQNESTVLTHSQITTQSTVSMHLISVYMYLSDARF